MLARPAGSVSKVECDSHLAQGPVARLSGDAVTRPSATHGVAEVEEGKSSHSLQNDTTLGIERGAVKEKLVPPQNKKFARFASNRMMQSNLAAEAHALAAELTSLAAPVASNFATGLEKEATGPTMNLKEKEEMPAR